jgi:glyoxylase-like metal-dependent hydrolase (beta-lactamase superfamily II)
MRVVIEHAPLEDELGDVLEKGMRQLGINSHVLAERAVVSLENIEDAINYRSVPDLSELKRLAAALEMNEVGLVALAQGQYPLPEIAGLPFCLYPLRTAHGIGVANAYIVADCSLASGILFDTGSDFALLRRVWPKAIRKLDAIFLTHPETEHIGGLAGVLDLFGRVPVFAPEGARLPNTMELGEGAKMQFQGIDVHALRTPGHVEAHNCYVVSVPRIVGATTLLISGDLLFAGSVGGAYFCKRQFTAHLHRLVGLLAPTTVVAPGHGPLTTIKNERQFNPFVM